MCFTIDQIDRACGLLLLTEFSTFVYCCKQCQCEFDSGPNLEVHILSQHQDDKESVIANVDALTDNFSAASTTIEHEPTNVKTEQFDYDAEVLDELNVDVSCVYFAKTLPVLSVNESFDIGDSGGTSDAVENEAKESVRQEQLQKTVTLGEATVPVEKAGHNSIETAHGVSTAKKQSRGRPPGTKNGTKSRQTLINEAIRAMTKRPVGRPKSAGTKDPAAKIETFYCDFCPELSFKHKHSLLKHMTLRHIRKDIAEKMKKCEICNKYPRYSYEHHMKMSHSKLEYKCEVCNAEFNRKMSYQLHLRTHTGEKPFLCSVCGKAFISKSTCNSHEAAVHAGVKKHKCSFCDRAFAQLSALKYHVNIAHTKERPFICEVANCKKNFASKWALKIHKATHEEPKLKCKYCDVMFTANTSRWRHEMVFHKKVIMVDGKYMNIYKKSHREKLKMLNMKDNEQQESG